MFPLEMIILMPALDQRGYTKNDQVLFDYVVYERRVFLHLSFVFFFMSGNLKHVFVLFLFSAYLRLEPYTCSRPIFYSFLISWGMFAL